MRFTVCERAEVREECSGGKPGDGEGAQGHGISHNRL